MAPPVSVAVGGMDGKKKGIMEGKGQKEVEEENDYEEDEEEEEGGRKESHRHKKEEEDEHEEVSGGGGRIKEKEVARGWEPSDTVSHSPKKVREVSEFQDEDDDEDEVDLC